MYDRTHENVRLLRNANGKVMLKQFTISYAHGHMHGIPNVALPLDSATSITYVYMLKSTNPIQNQRIPYMSELRTTVAQCCSSAPYLGSCFSDSSTTIT